jgi:hypothetical protein
MALTQAQFLQVVDATYPNSVNIWYNDEEPLTVYGLTIPVLDNTGTNTIQLLQTAQQLNISLNSQNYTFNVISRAERTAQDVTYYFFDVVDQTIDGLADDPANLPGQVLYIIPGFQSTNFFGGDYDALINNVEDSRQSTFIMISDRYKVAGGPGSLNPINIEALIAQTADRADVQDSNYSSTGWVNSRYEGTSTDSLTYGGIDSAITGRSFEGSLYPITISTDVINQQISSSQVVYDDYLSTSEDDLPSPPTFRTVSYVTNISSIAAQDTQIPISATGFGVGLGIGDIIRINNESEYMRVTKIGPYGSGLILTVVRRYNNTPTGTYNTGPLGITKIVNLSKIYKIIGNQIQVAQQGQLVVRDSQEILMLDALGQVIG